MKPRNTLCTSWLLLTICLSLSACKKEDPSGPVINNDLFSKVVLTTTGGSFSYPQSAVPDAADQFIYFVASDSTGTGVFKVPCTGGAATRVFIGAPFKNPKDLTLSTDNQTIYVADSTSGIFSLPIGGGVPSPVAGTSAVQPVAIDVIQRSGQDVIYCCGKSSGDAAILEIPTTGGSVASIRYKGSPLVSPMGITSAKDGTLFIADGNGSVYKLTTTNAISQLTGGIMMGYPPGIALTPDDGVVAVSSKSQSDGTAQVTIINLQTGGIGIFNKVIGVNSNPGGLHVARNTAGSTGKYAWCDVTRPGRVYHLEP
jgi:hypothetical protein